MNSDGLRNWPGLLYIPQVVMWGLSSAAYCERASHREIASFTVNHSQWFITRTSPGKRTHSLGWRLRFA